MLLFYDCDNEITIIRYKQITSRYLIRAFRIRRKENPSES